MHTTHRGRGLTALAAATALGLGALPAAAAPPDATRQRPAAASATPRLATSDSYCGIVWGSLARSTPVRHTTGTVSNVRSGRHTCFDRLVVDVADVPGSLSYDVRYVTHVHEEGSGRAIPLAGGADLQVTLRAPAYTSSGQATYRPTDRSAVVDVDGYRTFRQVAWGGSYEAQSTLGLGVRARLPFRVFVLDGPADGARLVIDVAHQW